MVRNAAHNVNKSQRNDYIYTLLFFYLRLAKNVYLEIFLRRQEAGRSPLTEVAVEYYSI